LLAAGRLPIRGNGRQGAVAIVAVEIRRCGSLQFRPRCPRGQRRGLSRSGSGPRFDAATSISGFPPSAPQRAELRHLSYAPVVSDHDGNARLALARGRHLASTSCGPVAASCGCGDCRLCKRARRAAALPLSRESKRPGRPAPAARRFCFVAKAVTTTRLPVLAGSRHVCRARNVAGIGALRQRHEQAVGQ
jgi:hypothetical protein